MKILITGGAGFIGSFLTNELSKDHEVIIFDNASEKKLKTLPPNAKFIYGDLRENIFFQNIPKVDVVYHLAAQTSVTFSLTNLNEDAEINILGTVNLVNWCMKNDIKKIIFISSASVYGNPKYLPIDEEHPTNPISPYGISKLTSEKYVSLIPNHIILRLSNVYGGIGNQDAVISNFVKRIKNKSPLEVFGDGTYTRDFIHVKDVVSACLLALRYDGNEKIFNVGSGKESSINEVAEIFKTLSPEINLTYNSPRIGDIKRSYFDISKITSEMKFTTTIDLRSGIESLLSQEDN